LSKTKTEMRNGHFELTRTIDVTPQEAWEVIGAVKGVDQWLGPITSCYVDGNKRVCGTEEGAFEEEIINVDHENFVFDYAIPQQHMVPVSNIKGQMRVTSASGKAAITWSWDYEVEKGNEEQAKGTFEMVGGMGIDGIESLIKSKAKAA
jgi:uncharacterized protein YndB with AHSA1/START domain